MSYATKIDPNEPLCLWVGCLTPHTSGSPYCWAHPTISWHYGGRGKNRKRIR